MITIIRPDNVKQVRKLGIFSFRAVLVSVVLLLPVWPDEILYAKENTRWSLVSAPEFREKKNGHCIEKDNSFVWYRCFIEVPKTWEGRPLVLYLGHIIRDQTYFNGFQVGGMGNREPFRDTLVRQRSYTISPKHVRYGRSNLIAVRVWNSGTAVGGSTRRTITW